MAKESNENPASKPEDPNQYASPPCYMAEVDPAYNGYLSHPELLDLLNLLLEGERAGARGINETCLPIAPPADHDTLRNIAVDEGRFSSMLYRHIVRLEGTPSHATGAFVDKLANAQAYTDRMDLLNRGQGWVVRKLRENLPRIDDLSLKTDLTEMLEVHVRNIEHATALLDKNDPGKRVTDDPLCSLHQMGGRGSIE